MVGSPVLGSTSRRTLKSTMNLPMANSTIKSSIKVEKLMDQFSEQLYELDIRLRKGLSMGKDLTKA